MLCGVSVILFSSIDLKSVYRFDADRVAALNRHDDDGRGSIDEESFERVRDNGDDILFGGDPRSRTTAAMMSRCRKYD